MSIAINLYDRDGTFLENLATGDGWGVQVRVDRGSACRRSATFGCDYRHIDQLRVMGRRIRIVDDTETVFEGSIDAAREGEGPSSSNLVVSCRDKTKKYLLAGFAEDTTYEDLTASDAQRAISSATATSNIGVGDEIQQFGIVYEAKLFATVLGTEEEVVPSSESGDVLGGDYSVDYSEAGLSQLRLSVGIDLHVLEAVTAATITTNGTVVTGTTETSQDGLSWTGYAGATSFRYLRFEVVKASGPITLGVAVTTSAAYIPGNVTTDDVDSWRPAGTDLDRRITLDIGSAQNCNVLYLRWGISSLDRSTVFAYLVERSTDAATWSTVGTYVANASCLAEHLFDSVSLRYVRVTVLTATGGLFALRYADLRLTTSTVSIDTVIDTIADTESETAFDLRETRRYAAATTFEAGSKKWDAMRTLAESIGHELFYSRSGNLTSKPRDEYDLSDVPVFNDVLALDREYSDAEVYNQVIAVHESVDSSLRSVQQDGDANSPTGIPNVGTRTAPIIQAPLADIQAKLDAFALAELQKASRQKVSIGFEDLADPTLEAGDVVQIVDARSGLDGYNVLEAFTLSYTASSRSMTCEVVPL